MQDIANFEGRGLPGVGIVSTEFVETAFSEAAALGFDPAVVFVPYPIQDRSNAALQALADEALASMLSGVAPAPG